MNFLQPYVVKPATTRRRKIHQDIETALALAEGANKAYNFFKEWRRRKFSYTVTISEADGLYQDVHDWLLSVLPHEKHRNLVVASARKHQYAYDEVSPASEPGKIENVDPLSIRFNDKTSREITIENYKVEVSLHIPETSDKSEKYFERYQVHNEISFTTFSYDGQQAVIRQLEKLNQARATTRKAVLKMTTQWGDWRTRSDLPPRSMDSVSLPKEQKDRIVADLGNFLESEERYNRLAIPWHRGYMFYGPPGTGKTSLVKALANHFNLDLWYISLSDLNAESNLLNLVGGVGPRSMLLLEDIDTIKITHDRDSSDSGKISTGSLLNTLDGVATPHGLITVMTTNRFDILDPALKRAGRMDLIEELTYPTKSTVRDMFEHFFNEGANMNGIKENEFIEKEISTSQIAEVFKRHMDEPQYALRDLWDLIKDRRLVS
jgi:predicted AAA+ superfamily ATPase